MKKLLSILSVVTLIGSSSISVVACGNKAKNSINDNKNLSELQKQMKIATETISKLVIGSRHENLNYNLNEILSMYLSPKSTAQMMPVKYYLNNNEYSISNGINAFTQSMAPALSIYDDNEGYTGIYASYIMGMYSNDFYQNFINSKNFGDTFNKKGDSTQFYTDDSAMGYYAGASNNLHLATEKERRSLAWGIQDTGALTNFLLNNGYTGGTPGTTAMSNGPKSGAGNKNGTNSSGYLYYNSHVMAGRYISDNDKTKNELKDSLGDKFEVTPSIDSGKKDYKTNIKNTTSNSELNFNSTGALLTSTAGDQNVNGHINIFASMFDNFTETSTGAQILAMFQNSMLPIFVDNTMDQVVTVSLSTGLWEGLNTIAKGASDNKNENQYKELLSELNIADDQIQKMAKNTVLNKPLGGFKMKDNIGVYFKENNKQKLDDFILFLQSFIEGIEKLETNSKYSEIMKQLIGDSDNTSGKGVFEQKYSKIIDNGGKGIGKTKWLEILGANDNKYKGFLNLAQMICKGFKNISNNEDNIKEAIEYVGNMGRKITSWNQFKINEKNKYLNILGFDGSKFLKDSFLGNMFHDFTDKDSIGRVEMKMMFDAMANQVSDAMKPVHENVLTNIVENKNWNFDFKKLPKSNTKKGEEIEMNVEYKGKGDSTSNADLQTKEVDVTDNFNPYQQNVNEIEGTNIKTTKAEILGLTQQVVKDDKELIAYDGLGNFQDLKQVNHKYKIKWQNIGNDQNPYWIIVSFKSFNKDGNEFYNIY